MKKVIIFMMIYIFSLNSYATRTQVLRNSYTLTKRKAADLAALLLQSLNYYKKSLVTFSQSSTHLGLHPIIGTRTIIWYLALFLNL